MILVPVDPSLLSRVAHRDTRLHSDLHRLAVEMAYSGGELSWGPLPVGGFRLRACLPVGQRADATELGLAVRGQLVKVLVAEDDPDTAEALGQLVASTPSLAMAGPRWRRRGPAGSGSAP